MTSAHPLERPTPIRGVYDVPFWTFVAEGRLRLQRCAACGHWWYPPGPSCPQCLSTSWSWEPVAGTGRLLSWVTFHRAYFPTVPVPHDVAAVELDEGPILIADVEGGSHRLDLGVPMRLCYREARDSEGDSFTLHGWQVDDRPGESPPEQPLTNDTTRKDHHPTAGAAS
jgi:uncharacterized OB-fold protein